MGCFLKITPEYECSTLQKERSDLMKGFRGEIWSLTEWISKLALINVLWIGFTILGLGIFGFIPATIAMFSVIREWAIFKQDTKIVSKFWSHYRSNFKKSNLFGLMISAVGLILFVDFMLFKSMGGFVSTIFIIVISSIGIMYVLTMLFIFPVFVHYNFKKLQIIKFSIMMSLAYPHYTIIMLSASIILLYVSLLMPVMFIFFSFSLTALTLMTIANKVFLKLEEKKEAIGEQLT